MLLKYLEYVINEGSINHSQTIYWGSLLETLLNNKNESNWSEISIKPFKWQPEGYHFDHHKYLINFKIGESEYDYYSVIIEKRDNYDFYYLENIETTKKFIRKFNDEFWKNASEYVKKLDYEPKCLGDLEHVRASNKYNL
jgi:hypothetical protein